MSERRLPKRPRPHVLEALSRHHVERVLPAEWICTPVSTDYGLDMRVEIVEDEQVTGPEFSMQLRATDRPNISDDNVIHRCKVSTAQYFLRRPEPVMYVLYDAQGQVAYWLWMQPYLRELNENCPGWRDQKSVQVRIPCENRLTPRSIPAIADHVRTWWVRMIPADGENLRDKELIYLDQLLVKFRYWCDHYTPLAGMAEVRAAVKDGPRLDLPMPFVPTGFEKLVEHGHGERTEVRQERVDDLRIAVAAQQRIILLGNSGSGKTTTLWRLAYDYANAALADAHAALPLLVPLAGYTDDEPFDAYLARHLGPLAPYLETYRALGRLILLLDGLDEMPQDGNAERVGRIQDVLGRYTDEALVITCRTLDNVSRLRGLQKVAVLPLDEMRVRTFLHKYLDKTAGERLFWIIAGGQKVRTLWEVWRQASGSWGAFWDGDKMPEDVYSRTTEAQRKLWARLRKEPPPLLAIGRNPYLLLMLAKVYTNTRGDLPANRAQLLATFVDTLLERERKRHPERWIKAEWQKNALAALAYAMQVEPGRATSVERSWAVTHLCGTMPNCDPERLLYLATSATLLDADNGVVRFYHPLLQEYFAARELRRRVTAGESLDCYWPPDSWWKASGLEETVILLAGMEPDASKLLEGLAHVNPALAARCLVEGSAWASEATRRDITATLMATMIDGRQPPIARTQAGDALARIGDNRPGVGVCSSGLPDILWCYVPSGPPATCRAESDEAPQHYHKSMIEGYFISRYLITNAQFNAFVKAGGYQERRYWAEAVRAGIWHEGKIKIPYEDRHREGAYDYGEPFNLPNHPVVGVTWYEAVAFCRWLQEQLQIGACGLQVCRGGETEIQRLEGGILTVRLPSEVEWERAVQGTDRHRYPWGEKPDPDKANCQETGIGSTSTVGCFPGGASLYGVDDLIGNVWEWTHSLWKGSSARPKPRTGHLWGGARTLVLGLQRCVANAQVSIASLVRYLCGTRDGHVDLQTDGPRVLCGGAFLCEARFVRCAVRGWAGPSASSMSLGFRVLASSACVSEDTR